MNLVEFKEKCKEAEQELALNEMLVIHPMDVDFDTGEVLKEGHIYKVKDDCVGSKYRTQDNPKQANLDIEYTKGVSVADFSDYVDNRDIIRKLMEIANSENRMSMKRYISDLGVDDKITDIDEDYDLDEIEDLEYMTMVDRIGEAYSNQQNQNHSSKQVETAEEEPERSNGDDD